MPKRYTIKELTEMSDYELLYLICKDREESVTNIYSHMSQRLAQLETKLWDNEKLTKWKR